jgi:hypothetical protein
MIFFRGSFGNVRQKVERSSLMVVIMFEVYASLSESQLKSLNFVSIPF